MVRCADPIEQARAYIAEHLQDAINFVDVARAVAFSPFHFHRIFQAAQGESITDYIRTRRLSAAARDLVATQERIIEIALAYRFESQASFTKAFRRAYGIAPGAYRRRGALVPMTETRQPLQQEHGIHQPPQLVTLPERYLVGMQVVGRNQNGEIPALWGQFNARVREIGHQVAPPLALGYCEMLEPSTVEGEFSYIAGMVVTQLADLPAGMVSRTVPAGTYVVFTHEGGLDKLGKSYEYIYRTWLPTAPYDVVTTHDYEVYDHRFRPDSDASVLEIHVPVRPR